MSRSYRKSSRSSQAQTAVAAKFGEIERQAVAASRELQLPLDVESLLEMTREALSSFAVEMGLKVAQCLLEDEVTQRCGQRHERVPGRTRDPFRPSTRALSRSPARRPRSPSRGCGEPTAAGKSNSSVTLCCNPRRRCRKRR